jgi:hypothetical protein
LDVLGEQNKANWIGGRMRLHHKLLCYNLLPLTPCAGAPPPLPTLAESRPFAPRPAIWQYDCFSGMWMVGVFLEFGSRRFVKRSLGIFLAAGLLCLACCNSSQASQTAYLWWNPNPGTNVAGYILHYGNVSGVYTITNDVGTNVTATVNGLKEGSTNYFMVTAYNALRMESPPSIEVPFFVPGVVKLMSAGKGKAAQLSFPIVPGKTNAIEASTNLKTWVTIFLTNCPTNCWITFSDPAAASNSMRFYRIHQLP